MQTTPVGITDDQITGMYRHIVEHRGRVDPAERREVFAGTADAQTARKTPENRSARAKATSRTQPSITMPSKPRAFAAVDMTSPPVPVLIPTGDVDHKHLAGTRRIQRAMQPQIIPAR